MEYIETKIFTTSQGTEPVMALLLSHGIDNISVDDPRDVRELIIEKDENEWDYIDPALITGDDEAVIFFYTENTGQGKDLIEKIKIDVMKLKSDELYGHFGQDIDFGRLYMDSNPMDDGWKEKWKEGIHPFKLTEHIVVKPTWEDYDAKADEQIIEIDPGMAFGTGSHETTRSCAVMLDKVINEDDDVLDIGTGSGILAIIASLLGAGKVDAYEIDPVAVEVAHSNLKINDSANNVNIIEGDILAVEISDKYDIIVSNLTSGIIVKMLPFVKNALEADGYLILSGMLEEEKGKMRKAFEDNSLTVKEEIIDGEWYTVLLKL